MATTSHVSSLVQDQNQSRSIENPSTPKQRACRNCGQVWDAVDLGGHDRNGPVLKFTLPGTCLTALLCTCGEALHFYTTVGIEPERQPSARERRHVLKQAAVNHVVRKVHDNGGTATHEDVATLRSIPAPVPAPDPIDILTECRKLKEALLNTHYETKGNWAGARDHFGWATQRQYALLEVSNDRVVLARIGHAKRGILCKGAPAVRVALIKRPTRTWLISRMGLERGLRQFVREAHPDLPERVEPAVVDVIPF
jgi:hypothetical protein